MNQQSNPIQQPEHLSVQDDRSNESQFSDDFQSDHQGYSHHTQRQINDAEKNMEEQVVREVVKNPVSPYMSFVKSWKVNHPDEKMNISLMGDIWNKLTDLQKSVYETKYKQQKAKFDEYTAYMMAKDPNYGKKSTASSKKFFFPLSRVKTIMKQDNFYTASTDNVTAMTRSAQYFGQFLLEEIKKTSEGKKRIDATDLFDCINANQTNLWFLDCLIDEYNEQKQAHPKVSHHQSAKKQKNIDHSPIKQKSSAKPKTKKSHPALLKGQMKLTDMF